MPVVSQCESSGIAQPPARFKASADEEAKQAIKQQVPVLAPPPKYSRSPSTPRPFSDQKSSRAQTAPGSTGPAGVRDCREAASTRLSSALTTSERASSPRPQLSIMELVNQAAKRAEDEAAVAAAAKRAGPRQLGQGTAGSDRPLAARSQLPSSRYGSSNNNNCNGSRHAAHRNALATCQHSSAAAGATAANMIPCSPVLQQGRSKHQLESPQRACISPKAAAMPAAHTDNSKLKDASPRAAAVQSHPLPTGAFDQHSKLSVLVPASQCSQGSDCGSDDPMCLASVSSLCSSSSSSSLCSTISCGSNASTLSTASRPKSILLTRSSTSSSASSPRFSKRVTWKDGQADEAVVGQELVAVRLLMDTPEMRQIRKDTWPERPGARRQEQEEEQAVAAAQQQQIQHVRQQQQMQQQSGAGLVSKLLEPSRLNDWREKLCMLQLERRQQRMEQVQARWNKQQAKQARKESQTQQQQQHQHQQQQAVDQQAVSTADADCVKPAGCGAAGAIHINAVARQQVQSAAC